MEKKIQIPLSLYELMVAYVHDHYDPADRERYNAIQFGVKMKQNAEIRHNLYTAYKKESDLDTREMLRNSYLDKAGVTGRWSETTERKYMNGEFYD